MRHVRSQHGVSLVIALALLATVSLLLLSFSVAMRSERYSARGALNDLRAKQLVHVAVAEAAGFIAREFAGTVYSNTEVYCSSGTDPVGRLLYSGDATNYVPGALAALARGASGDARWIDVSDGARAVGRVAYLIVDCSGLLDANFAGGLARTTSTSVAELDVSSLPDFAGSPADFYDGRARHRRYESVPEISRLNSNALTRPVQNLFAYSYDPGRDEMYRDLGRVGTTNVELFAKMCVNTAGVDELRAAFTNAGFVADAAAALARNVQDYLDEDRVPRGGAGDPRRPELSSLVQEAVPMINEVVVRETSFLNYEVAVELFFPFVPAEVVPSDGFGLQLGVSSNQAGAASYVGGWTLAHPVGSMYWGGTNAFRTFASPTITFPHPTNPAVLTSLGDVVALPPPGGSRTNTIWFIARVTAGSNTADQAWGPDPVAFRGTGAWSVEDPRANGNPTEWEAQTPTLGTTNANSHPREGLPIFHRDGPMQNIGEVGCIYLPPGTSHWQSVDLLSEQGGRLLDTMTVRPTNAPARGLVSLSSPQTNVLAALFAGLRAGYSNEHVAVSLVMTNAAVETLVGELFGGAPYQSWSDLLADPGVAAAFGSALGEGANDYLREAPLRHILDLVTFRQNLFTILVAAQALGPGGRPVSERRAVVVLCRDAYTGRCFVRSFRYLME